MVAKIEQKPAGALLALALASSLIATGCASLVRPASAGVGTGVERAQVVHDQDNPYWIGATRVDDASGSSRVQVIKDPENPYWIGNTAATAPQRPYAEPLHGPR
jgi:hypothetical protein